MPPEIDFDVESIFKHYPDMTMSKIQAAMLKHNGRVNLSKMINIEKSEFQYFKMTMLSINHKKYPLKKLMLNDCELTDGKFSALVPLICKFKSVTLNGTQKIGVSGWTTFSEYLIKHGSKLEKLELKIAKTEASAMQLGRKMEDFVEDLEEIDQAGWEVNDKVMELLAPALARIKEVHLGQTAITEKGWETLKKAIKSREEKQSAWGTPNKLAILNLSLMSRQNVKGEIKYIQPSHMKELSNVLIKMEHVNLAGQQLIRKAPRKESNTEKSAEKSETGWQIFQKIIKETDSGNLRLKSLDVTNCGMDTDVIQRLKRALPKKVKMIIDEKGQNHEDQTTSCCGCCI